MLQPKRVKYRKTHRGRMRGIATTGNVVSFGEIGLQALEPAWITARQIEAARRTITHHLKRGGKVWIRVLRTSRRPPSLPKRAWVAAREPPTTGWRWLQPGRMLFEVGGVQQQLATEALRLAAHKLPIQTRLVEREVSVTTL